MLISKTELDSNGSRDLIPLECLQCHKTHFRTKNIVLRILNGNLKGTMKGCFCSPKCSYEYEKVSKKIPCKECGNLVERSPSELRGKEVFCSTSCSATFYNRNKISLPKNKCKFCGGDCYNIYCSTKCSSKQMRKDVYDKISKGEVEGHSVHTLRQYLLTTRGCKCEMCGITEWGGKPLVVVMDHINGNSNDNMLSNLRLICSNCDTLTPTYKCRNKGSGRHYRRMRYAEGKSY